MGQGRMGHTCSQVYVQPSDHPGIGNIAPPSNPGAVLSVAVAGGEAGQGCWVYYSSSGVYMDNDRAVHPVTSVEVYLPWNDTWVGLADMPDGEQEGLKMKINQAGMIYSLSTGHLFLLGGQYTDYNADKEYDLKTVFDLALNSSSHNYYWQTDGNPDLGKWRGLLLTVIHI